MTKYFGTDGIRGKANEGLTVELALKVGQYLGYTHRGKKIVVGQDTRLSSTMFASAIAAGATSYGADVYLLGVCATPALAYTVNNHGFEGGVMISASHNPYHDNGLKCFASNGMKISSQFEDEIESYIDGDISIEPAHENEIGRVIDFASGVDAYLEHIESLIDVRFDNLKIVLDCANGSAVSSAENAFKTLGANVIVMNNEPDGININTNCGSTHPESLMDRVVSEKADMGFAFDGDADRCLAVDHKGNLVDGDGILYILGRYLKEKEMLKDDTIVSTVMANIGFKKVCEKYGLNVITTQVGDRYVYQEMFANDYKLGGEQSGHIILKDYATTGDGVLTALVLSEVAVKHNQSLFELNEEFVQYPQLLENLRVKDKKVILEDATVAKEIERIENELGDEGRILVRPSGTEPLIRVMVEAQTQEICDRHVSDMIEIIKNIG